MVAKARRSRRRWSEAFKRRVVAESAAPGVSAAAIARRYDLNANLKAGVNHFVIRFWGKNYFGSIDKFASDVMPHLKEKDESSATFLQGL